MRQLVGHHHHHPLLGRHWGFLRVGQQRRHAKCDQAPVLHGAGGKIGNRYQICKIIVLFVLFYVQMLFIYVKLESGD